MKLKIPCFIFLFIFLTSTLTNYCDKNDFCMQCGAVDSNTRQCQECFNWGSGNVGGRSLLYTPEETQTCTHWITNTIKDCKYYDGATYNQVGITYNTCRQCKSDKKFYNLTINSSGVRTGMCEKNANSNYSGCTQIGNCDTTVCYIDQRTNTSHTWCNQCTKGYIGTQDSSSSFGSTTCTANSSITNCEYYEVVAINGISIVQCYSCMDDYVVACQEESIGGSNFKVCNQCVPNDPVGDGCRIMNYNRNGCWTCFHSYYFDQDKCVLGAFLVNCYTYNFVILLGVYFLYWI